jgi:hypothetical protein
MREESGTGGWTSRINMSIVHVFNDTLNFFLVPIARYCVHEVSYLDKTMESIKAYESRFLIYSTALLATEI